MELKHGDLTFKREGMHGEKHLARVRARIRAAGDLPVAQQVRRCGKGR